MKRFLSKIVTVVIALIVALTTLTGCNLVTVDSKKDMQQVVAEISIGNGAPTQKIYKKDLVIMYMNYGSYYIQNMGYTQKQTFELIMNELVTNILLVQYAENYYADKNGVTEDKFNVDNYLTDLEIAKATYNTNKAFNDLIEDYIDSEDEEVEETETSTEEVRTVPSGAVNYEDEFDGKDEKTFYDDYNKEGFKSSGIVTGFDDNYVTIDAARRTAYGKLIKALELNALLGDDFNAETDSIYETQYYEDNLVSQKESILISNYEKDLTLAIMQGVTFADLENRYAEMYDAKVNGTLTDYETSLDSASNANPVVYNPYTGYSYVYNLLLGVNDSQTAEISAINAKTNLSNQEKRAQRQLVLESITAKDLRSTWITAGYDFDGTYFTGDYSFAPEGERLEFKGTVTHTNADEVNEEDYKAEYKVESVTKYDLDEFIAMMDNYLYGATATNANVDGYRKSVKNTVKPNNYDEKVKDLLFAFSTDGGSLSSTYKGYLVKPEADVTGTETYVKEFAEGARLVTDESKGFGAGSYVMVDTDYGYHIIFNSQTITANDNYATLTAYLDSLGVEKKIEETTYNTWAEYYNAMLENIDTIAEDNADFYLYTFQQAYVGNILSTRLSQKKTQIINTFKTKNDDGEYEDFSETYVKKYEKRYSEYLIEE